ncbi:MAG: amidase [Planctomycetaceae bacterium]|nr:amidase [Planctomycetaceae bacterium]
MSDTTAANDLTRRSACELAQGVRSGNWSAAEVTQAHIARIAQINPTLNAVCVPLFEQARHDAAKIDEARQRGEPLGPLAGVPLTIKECFDVTGTPTTLGMPSRVAHQATADAVLVGRVRRAGGVVLGKTNVPQLMLLHESDNPLYGRTLHPTRPERSPGGSSGGEASIIAAHGSPLGLASDLGGSIRQPAHSCGICGFKPTTSRLTNRGSTNIFTGLEVLGGQPGPMARSVDDLMLAMQVLCHAESPPLETVTPPLPWRDMLAGPMPDWRVGYWSEDGFTRPSPAIRRAVDEVAHRLASIGIPVERFEPPAVPEAMQMYFHLISANGGGAARRLTGHDPLHPAIRRLLRLGRCPGWLRPLLSGVLNLIGQRQIAWMIRNTGAISTGMFWQLTAEVRRYQRRFLELINARGFTTLICPPHALVALTHGSSGYLSSAAASSMLINLLGFPAGVVPWTTVAPGEESDRRASGDWFERAALAVEAGSAGLPVGVQIVGRPWEDEATLAMMAIVEGLRRDCGGD